MSARHRIPSAVPRLAPLAAALSLCFGTAAAPAATIAVTSSTGAASVSSCTIVDAVTSIDNGALSAACTNSSANAFGSSDTIDLSTFTSPTSIVFSAATTGSDALYLSKPVTISGRLDADAKPLVTLARTIEINTAKFRLIETNADLTLIGVAVQNGISDAGTNTGGMGGGILAVNKGNPITLTLSNSVVSGNSAVGTAAYASYGGGIYASGANVVLMNSTISGNSAYQGGGIDAGSGNVYVSGSTISDNNAQNGYAGGIHTMGTAALANSTFSGNYASGGGGAVDANSVDMRFCTFSGNSTVSGKQGGGVRIHANSTAYATLMFANDSGVYGNDVAGTIAGLYLNGDHDLIGTVGANVTAPRDRLTCDPGLGALANNGGPTQTMALSAGSCAIDVGPVTTNGFASDQRGALFERRSGSATDIGAFEYQPANDRIFYDGFEP
jgi:hypothetical protein